MFTILAQIVALVTLLSGAALALSVALAPTHAASTVNAHRARRGIVALNTQGEEMGWLAHPERMDAKEFVAWSAAMGARGATVLAPIFE